MSKKLTYEFVKKAFENNGYTLLSEEYKNNQTKLDYICPKGHINSMIWASWKRGHRCPTCATESTRNSWVGVSPGWTPAPMSRCCRLPALFKQLKKGRG